MNHDQWLREAQSYLHKVNQNIITLTNEVNNIISHSKQLQHLTNNSLGNIEKRGLRTNEMHQIHSNIRDALSNAIDLGHETELVLNVGYFIQHFGIDLDDILKGGELKGFTGQVSIKQRDRAVLSSGDNSVHPMAVAPGEMGIHVPLEADVLGESFDFEINFNAIFKKQRTENQFEFVSSRHTHLDKLVATRTVSRTIREQANQDIERYNRKELPPLPNTDFGQGTPRYYSSAYDDEVNLIRFFGTYGGKRRSHFARIQRLPSWAQVGIKTGSHIFVEMIHKKIIEAGLNPGSVQFVGSNRFRTTASVGSSKTTRIGCDDFGVTVQMTFFLEGHIDLVDVKSFRLQVHEYRAVDTDINYHPGVIDFLFGWVDGFVKSFISRMAPTVNFSQYFFIPNASRIAVDLNNEHFSAFIAL